MKELYIKFVIEISLHGMSLLTKIIHETHPWDLRSSSEYIWTLKWTFKSRKELRISWVPGRLSASRMTVLSGVWWVDFLTSLIRNFGPITRRRTSVNVSFVWHIWLLRARFGDKAIIVKLLYTLCGKRPYLTPEAKCVYTHVIWSGSIITLSVSG